MGTGVDAAIDLFLYHWKCLTFLQELSVYQGKLCEFLGGTLLLQFIKDTPRSLLFGVQKKANLHPAC